MVHSCGVSAVGRVCDMRAVRVNTLEGPAAITVEDIPEPSAEGPFGPQVLIEVKAVGISFPDLLLSKGEYQVKPDLPFTLGVDFAGTIKHAPDGSGLEVASAWPRACRTAAPARSPRPDPTRSFPFPTVSPSRKARRCR